MVDAVSRAPAEAMLVFDRRGTILGLNGEAERLFGFTGDELVGGNVERVLTVGETWRLPGPGTPLHPLSDGADQPLTERMGHAVSLAMVGHNRAGAMFRAELVVVSPAGSNRLTAIVRRRPDRETADRPDFEPRGPDTPAATGPDASRLLICEPDPGIAARLRAMLERAGFRVDLALDADQARQLIGIHGYAAMTVDLMLPDQDGLALVRDLRRRPETRDLPVIVVSAKAGQGRHNWPEWPERHDLTGGAFGLVDWIQKPADDRRLTEALRHAIGDPGPHRHRVLHVEDDRDLIRLVAAQVGDIALVEAATTLGQARLRLASEPFDLVILDLRLPDGSGFELLDDIKKLVPPVPVLLVSATEITPHSGAALAGALIKSRTTDRDLVNAIRSLAAASASSSSSPALRCSATKPPKPQAPEPVR
jgi:CheY-like chemotaxis protein